MKKTYTAIINLILILVLTIYPVGNFLSVMKSSAKETSQTTTDISALQKLSDYDLKKAQSNIKKAEKERMYEYNPSKYQVQMTLENLEKGKTTYKKIFKNTYIVGDSLMHGLEAYGILNSNHLITQVSASLYHLDSNIKKICEIAPPILIIHYGVNMISTEKYQLDSFIAKYTKLIKEIQKGTPDTRIIISGLFPVDESIAKAPRFKKIAVYNSALKNMCASLKIEFLDSTPVLKNHSECYGGDGIHLSKSFYEKYWLKYLITELKIY